MPAASATSKTASTHHEERFQNVRGVAIAFGALLTLVQFLIDYLRRK